MPSHALKVLCLALVPFGHSQTVLAQSSLLPDRKTGCKMMIGYDSNKVGPRQFEWNGSCPAGLAEGFGTVRYFASDQLYWTDNVTPGSGVEIRKGEFIYQIEQSTLRFRMTGCERTKMQAVVQVPSELNLQFGNVFWAVIKAGNDYALSQTDPDPPRASRTHQCPRYNNSGDLWKRDNEIILVRDDKQIGWARSTRWREKPQGSYEHGGETWMKWSNHSLIAAENHRASVFNALMRQQQARHQEEQRQAQERVAAARRAEADKAARQAQAAEAERQAGVAARVQELTKLAEADARDRGLKRSADSFCLFSCDPTEHDGRLAFAAYLKAKIERLMVVAKFRKTNGVKGKRDGFDIYELYYSANIELPEGFMDKQKPGQLTWMMGGEGMSLAMNLKSMMTFERTEKKEWWEPQSLGVTGRILLRKTEKGWELVGLLK